MAREWQMRSYPVGQLRSDDFILVEKVLPPLAEGQLRIRNAWLSIDPSVRWRMDRSAPIKPLGLGEVPPAPIIGRVTESRSPRFGVGTLVSYHGGWCDEAVVEAELADSLPSIDVPPQAFLGQLGIPGLTAYVGLIDIAAVRAGDIVFISAAAGAVGLAAVQIAKTLGATVIGSAGGAEKMAILRDFGADEVIDYKAPGALAEMLNKAAPNGIDVYFDNVGGDHLDAALQAARPNARFSICGMVSEYNDDRFSYQHLRRLISATITARGFRIGEHMERQADFYRDAADWVATGRFRTLETVREGLEQVPAALRDLLSGHNRGKMIVKI